MILTMPQKMNAACESLIRCGLRMERSAFLAVAGDEAVHARVRSRNGVEKPMSEVKEIADNKDAQEAFLRAFLNLQRYDPARSFKTWLLTIASNYCIDRLRRRTVRQRTEHALEQPAEVEGLDPWSEAESSASSARIRAAMSSLTPGSCTAATRAYLAFFEQHPELVELLMQERAQFKDRKKAKGPNMPWGQGDTPITEVLQLMKKRQWTFPATIELEYPVPEGSTRVAEIAKCLAYCRAALTS